MSDREWATRTVERVLQGLPNFPALSPEMVAVRIVDAPASQPVVERQITDDARSAVVLVAPTSPDVNCGWQGMALAGGKVVNSIVGGSRAVVLEDCVDALGAALALSPNQPEGE